MLRRCLKVAVRLSPARDGVRADEEVRAENVGHRVPTGFIDRHLVLVVEALDAAGGRVCLQKGSTLSRLAGRGFEGLPGQLYAKQLRDEATGGPLPFWLWLGRDDPADTRLHPGRPDRRAFTFAPGVERVRVRLLYRRFWPEVAERRGWPDNEIMVTELTTKLVRD
jgi:hypothetical protein